MLGLFVLCLLAVQGLRQLWLLLRVRWQWTRRGVRCLVVSSNSPNWEAHIRTVWLPRFGARAVTLAWSDPARRRRGLAVRVYRWFGAAARFTPVVIIFRGLRQPYVFRFAEAFRYRAAGRPEYLSMLEEDMWKRLDEQGSGERR